MDAIFPQPAPQEPSHPLAAATPPAPRPPEDAVMVLLNSGVPLSLLLDLTAPVGPRSHEILVEEGGPQDAWWEQQG